MPAVMKHAWDLSEEEAIRLQQEWAGKVSLETPQGWKVRRVAGVDVAYDKNDDRLIAAVVVLDAETLEVVETAAAEGKPSFPYIPGLFSFRELPPVLQAFKRLKTPPDLIVCDGQGIAHPRRFGLASHLGLLLDIPTIGCGKTRLIGEHEEPGGERGSASPLVDGDETIGCCLRTQNGVKPVYVSAGHRLSQADACEWILKLTPRYRLPETTRQADQCVKRELGKPRN